jgi:hypothetical protein
MVTARYFQAIEARIGVDGSPQLLKGVGVASARAEGHVNILIQTIHAWILSLSYLQARVHEWRKHRTVKTE